MPAAHQPPGPSGCPVRMSDWEPCGRPIHSAPAGVDTGPVCLMHSRDPNKDKAQFRQEIEAILNGTSTAHGPKDRFDFTQFVFPEADFTRATFTRDAYFRSATFTQNADFTRATFTQNADFFGATFTQNGDFSDATFSQNADFSEATFTQDANFFKATFTQNANFSGATFTQNARFRWAEFAQNADFFLATFTQNADFFGATFTQNAKFAEARFTRNANFSRAKFTKAGYFSWATFSQNANFSQVTFNQYADFRGATFTQNADFQETVFGPRSGPEKRAAPAATNASPGIADFTGTRFEKAPLVRFYQVNKKSPQGLRARFLNCDVEGIHFVDVNWHEQGDRMVLQDELDVTTPSGREDAGQKAEEEEERKPETRHELVAIAYRQLVNNFEKVRVYDLAEDCYIGAMEMKRLDPGQFSFARTLAPYYQKWRWLRWLGEHVSAVNLYRWASHYGSSYRRAFEVLIFLVIMFAVVFAFTEMKPRYWVAPPPPLNPWVRGLEAYPAGLMHSLEVATFQRETLYIASEEFDKLLSIAENVLVPAQLALLLLALRRRFRR